MWHNALSEFPPYAPQLLLADTMRREIDKSLFLQFKDGVELEGLIGLGFETRYLTPRLSLQM